MKKRSRRVKRSSARKSSSRKSVQHVLMLPFSLRRIVLVTTCIVLFVFAFVIFKNPGRQAVAGIQMTNGLFSQATISMPQVADAVSYNIYYKEKNESIYKNAVRSIPPTVNEYNISYLTKGAEYTYKISAVDSSGAEMWWSEEKSLKNLQPM